MTVPLVRVEGDFAVARPIPFDEDDTLRDHVDRVVDALTATGRVIEVSTEAQLEVGNVKLAVVVADVDERDADRVGRETIAASIREADARHTQLLSAAEEEALGVNLPSRSGLLTPVWRLRTMSIGPVEGG
jgi:hypothetical protein